MPDDCSSLSRSTSWLDGPTSTSTSMPKACLKAGGMTSRALAPPPGATARVILPSFLAAATSASHFACALPAPLAPALAEAGLAAGAEALGAADDEPQADSAAMLIPRKA